MFSQDLIREVAQKAGKRAGKSGGFGFRNLMGSLESHPDLPRFLDSLLKDPEVLSRSGYYLPIPSFHRDPIERIDTEAQPERLQPLWDRVAAAWMQLGETEPDWSAVTQDDFRGDQFTKSQERFYETGRVDADRFFVWLEAAGILPSRLESLLEFGCGTGRVTYSLAGWFRRVNACDVSWSHLKLAQSRLEVQGRKNIDFLLARSPRDLDALPPSDAVFSIMVLQHNPPPVMARILASLFRLVNPGGVVYVQVPVHKRGYRFALDEYLATPAHPGEMEMHVLPQHVVFALAAEGGCIPLRAEPDNYISWPDGLSMTYLFRKRS
jgi:SAM-dependent methyltransferase